jgi:hypothetical protein
MQRCGVTAAVALSVPTVPSSDQPLLYRRGCARALAMAVATALWHVAWSMPYHSELPFCACLRCAWRRRNARFWSALGRHARKHAAMSFSDSEEEFPFVFAADGGDDDDGELFRNPNFGGGAAPEPQAQHLPIVQQADLVLQPVPAAPAMPAFPIYRRPDRKFAGKFPHVQGEFDSDIAIIDWQ